jgi:hypothetical protein
MSKQERSTQSTDKQNLNREQKPGAKQQQGAKQQGAQAQSGAQDRQNSGGMDREKQQDTGHHQSGGFAGWEQDHKKDLKQ